MSNKVKLIKLEDENQRDLGRIVYAALYARYSSVGNSHYSAEEQIERIKFRLERGQIQSRKFPGCKIVINESWVIKDEAKTGRVTREGYELVRSGIINQEFDLLLVDDISRLSRDMGDTIDLYEVLSYKNVEGFSVNDSISTLDPNAKDIWVFKGYANEAQSKATSKNTIRGLEVRVIGGYSTGHVPYGFDSVPTKTQMMKGNERPSHFEPRVNEQEAAVIRRIWQAFADGHGPKIIARSLNEDGISPPDRKRESQRWSERTIKKMLWQKKYLGTWEYRKTKVVKDPIRNRLTQQPRPKEEWLVTEMLHLRIISPELEKRVEERKEEINRKGKIYGNLTRMDNTSKHLFVGSVTCHECGGNFVVVSGKGYMGCFNAHRETTVSCKNNQTINMATLEESLLDELWKIIEKEEVYKLLATRYNQLMAKKHGDAPARIEELDRLIAGTEKSIANFVKFIADGNASEFVVKGLKEAENKLSLHKKEREYLVAQLNETIYVTPSAVKKKLLELPQLLAQKTVLANQIIKNLIPGKIKLTPTEVTGKKTYLAEGVLNFHSVMQNTLTGELQTVVFSRMIGKLPKPQA